MKVMINLPTSSQKTSSTTIINLTKKDTIAKNHQLIMVHIIKIETPFEDNSLVYNPSAKPTETENVDPNYKISTDNLTKEERPSITELREKENIILKKGHKGRGMGNNG